MKARGFLSAVAALAATLGAGAACQGPAAGPRKLVVQSNEYKVDGSYAPANIDRVDGVRVDNGRLVLKGVPADVTVDFPAIANPDQPTRPRHWALVTDAHVGGRRLITFTEAEFVKDVSIELPDGDAPVHFDVFAARDEGEVLVFALGDRNAGQQSLVGHITIKHK
jgi:hypothetical protein